jgi:RraA family protein
LKKDCFETSDGAVAKPKSSEMNPGPGFMVRKSFARVDEDVIDGFREFETTDVSDALNRMYTTGSDIQNLANHKSLVGTVVTVKVFPGDNLMVHKALDLAKPGDVIAVDASQSKTAAVVGDLIANKAKSRGIAGFVIDGFVRDLPGIVECGLPIYAIGVTPFGPLHRGPGEINYPISLGGVVVQAGDIVSADRSGVVVVPSWAAKDTLERLRENRDRMSQYVADVKRGRFSNAWVDDQLNAEGCQFNE